MITGLLKKIFGNRNERLIKQYRHKVAQISALKPKFEALTDTELQAKAEEFRQRFAKDETLDALLPGTFVVCREANKRIIEMRHFDVQLISDMMLHDGKVAEMHTGEGETLTAMFTVYLSTISGQGMHVVTINGHLTQCDTEWVSRLCNWPGLSVGVNLTTMGHNQEQGTHTSDITYGTNNEFGFDYLRDNMVYDTGQRVQRPLSYMIVDEVDSILIDEVRTLLIVPGQVEGHTGLYRRMDSTPAQLTHQVDEEKSGGVGVEKSDDYYVDERSHQVYLTESSHEKAEHILLQADLIGEGESLYAPQNITLTHHLYAALHAHSLFFYDQRYVVQSDEVTIVGEFTGRLITGRRWSDGLHQVVRTKEGMQIQQENQTLATTTSQNYFRIYSKLSGTIGTADTEAYEFQEIYGLETVMIPTNRTPQRKDLQDQIYKTSRERYNAIIRDIHDCYERSQPVLVGTTSIGNSELLSNLLDQGELPHQMLNAKQHERETAIIAETGHPKAITIATNMTGRGTDIVLGNNVEKQVGFVMAGASLSDREKVARVEQLQGEWQSLHEQVKAAGGLHVVDTEHREPHRIDNQLRGRAGRQGDPGSSRFYLSLDDQLLRIFAGGHIHAIMDRPKMPENEPIEADAVMRSIESAQHKVKGHNFDICKQLLQYDDVSNGQRKKLYKLHSETLEAQDVDDLVKNPRGSVFTELFRTYMSAETMEKRWDVVGLEKTLHGD